MAQLDIDHAHALVGRAHPGVMDPDDAGFQDWFRRGHRAALALARRADTPAKAFAALRFYVTGYRDGHLAVWQEQPLGDPSPPTWAGWTVQWQGGAYRVVKHAATWSVAVPALGDVLVSCDGVPVDVVLARRVAPYLDRRLHLEGTRSRLALHLTNQWPGESPWQPLRPKRCAVQDRLGRTVQFDLAWRESSEGLTGIHAAVQPPGVAPLAGGLLWIHATDFVAAGEAASAFEALLDQVRALRGADTVVLDTRGNRGGNSLLGYRLLRALLKGDTPASPEAPRAYWRVSDVASTALGTRMKALLRDEGPNGVTARFTSGLLARLDEARRTGQPFVEQVEPDVEVGVNDAGPGFAGRLILLTDAHCASACLDFADLVLRVPGAVHVGSATSGDTRYIDVAEQVLPSGTRLWVPLKVWRHRGRDDNQPLVPSFPYEGDIGDTRQVQAWVRDVVLPRLKGKQVP